MKTLPVLAAAAAMLSAASAHAAAPGQTTPVPRNCPLVITFASHGAGIDRPTFDRVEYYLAHERNVTSVSRYPWGREGEVSLCVRARGDADLVRIANHVRTSVPARPRGPVTVESRLRRW